MRKRYLLVLTVAGGLALAGAVAAPASAAHATTKAGVSAKWRPAPPPPKRSFTLDGTVGAVDATASTITVNHGASTTISVNSAAAVVINRAAATLSATPTGARVRVSGTVTNGKWNATRIDVTTRWSFGVDGTVTAVDPDASTITVNRGSSTVTVPVDGAAVVTIDHAASTLAAVPAGARVRVRGTVTNSVENATTLDVTTRWSFGVDGTVTAVDPDASTITVNRGSSTVTVPVDGAAVVTIDHAASTLSAVQTGGRVRISGIVTNGIQNATRIDVTTRWSFGVDGTVTAVDTTASTITVNCGGRNVVVPVDSAARVTLNRATTTLSALPTGARVTVRGTVTNGVQNATRVEATTPPVKKSRYHR
ncbi:hypothetical protein [Micromonospora sp. NPDC049679]|uniref:hypothetical protein n=1 Tax=Micromonospora sp. NPDC049679 TaxID=3155920 RepID=UPI0033DEB8E1